MHILVIERDKQVCEAGVALCDEIFGYHWRLGTGITFDNRNFISIPNSELSQFHVVVSCISNITPFFSVKFVGLASCLEQYNSTHIKLLVASKSCCRMASDFISIRYEKFVSFEYIKAKYVDWCNKLTCMIFSFLDRKNSTIYIRFVKWGSNIVVSLSSRLH